MFWGNSHITGMSRCSLVCQRIDVIDSVTTNGPSVVVLTLWQWGAVNVEIQVPTAENPELVQVPWFVGATEPDGPISRNGIGSHCIYIIITVEVKPRIAKQYKCHYCCFCMEGKCDRGWKKVSLHCFPADQKVTHAWKKYFFWHPFGQFSKAGFHNLWCKKSQKVTAATSGPVSEYRNRSWT